ncbi:hypothetical protein Rsub_08644 [Raphidocelis subcapitata]|uniref:Uncharacterized protein n=1 Tax=Raphidocelis subcapitata TaxID=307507 RepID=A0A2V0P9P0_9CHLO|nr:hypothetical protein Rsub_08644 [Raphidocelis subcapitata]|eukprot:GBF95662.1 hypothetical protein Rsub_08644 [Raphidocelis subcapitata]
MATAAAGAASAELDLTNSHLQTLESVDIHEGLTALDLTANRLKDIDPRILALKGLRSLNFRQNLLTDVSAWDACSCKDTLEDLEFRDNQLTAIPPLSGFKALRRLEFSYNEIRSMGPVSSLACAPLQELYVASNKVPTIEGLSELTRLTVLELGSNRIRQIEGLEGQGALAELWLGRNRIPKIEGLGHLTNLVRISLQSNRLESMLGLEGCTSLQELYLSHNGIARLEGLSTLTRLKVLDVSNNRIAAVENLTPLTALEDLWLNDNLIPGLDGLAAALAAQRGTLTTVYFSGNPCAKDPGYRATLLELLPRLEQLDDAVLSGKG